MSTFALTFPAHLFLDVPLVECRSSEEFAHEAGIAYSSDTAAEDELVHDANY
ncbi:hypothetical protein GGF38_002553, partial [Coemansia sp. RSA 25]